MSIIARRIREARQRLGISQERLGVLAGIDEFSASARINQYERDKHRPDLETTIRLAAVLGVPTPFFYTEDDALAELLLMAGNLPEDRKKRLLAYVRRLTVPQSEECPPAISGKPLSPLQRRKE